MTDLARNLTAWLADVMLGPICPLPTCRYRARGHRSLAAHIGRHVVRVKP